MASVDQTSMLVLPTSAAAPPPASSATRSMPVSHLGEATVSATVVDTQSIDPTPSVTSVSTAYHTDLTASKHTTQIYSSYGSQSSDSSQFAMQHATSLLPSDTLSSATMEVTSSGYKSVQTLKPSVISETPSVISVADKPSDSVSQLPVSSSVTRDKQPTVSKVVESTSTKPGVSHLASSVSQSRAKVLTSSSRTSSTVGLHTSVAGNTLLASSQSSVYQPSVSETDLATAFLSISSSQSVILTSPVSSSLLPDSSVGLKVLPSGSVLEPASRELFSAFVPSKTSFTTEEVPLDSGSLKSTPAVPFTPPSVKPISPSDSEGTALFSGGLYDYMLYIGAPVCGVIVLIVLIVCLCCLHKRKNKLKGSPAKARTQDLWLNNSQPELPLNAIDHLQGSNRGPKALASLKCSKPSLQQHRDDNASDSDDNNTGDSDDNNNVDNDTDSDVDETDPEIDELINVEDNLEEYASVTEDDVEEKDVGDGGGTIHDVDDDLEAEAGNGSGMEDDAGEDDAGEDDADEQVEAIDYKDDTDRRGTGDKEEHAQLDDEGCTRYEVVFDFQAELESHLTLHQGDIVTVQRKEDNGWWRGHAGDRGGWFPNSYVQAAPLDNLETENEVEMHNESSNMSSFIVGRSAEGHQRDSCSTEGHQRDSYPTEEDILAEPIYCKIQPKDKTKAKPADRTPTKPEKPMLKLSRENSPITFEDGNKFIAVYQHNSHCPGELNINKGDIITGREQDRNGWMNGYNENTQEVGWFPAVYVQKWTDTGPSGAEEQIDGVPDKDSYHHLKANTEAGEAQDWVGIIHQALHTFTAEKAGDLEFETGDHITVIQILENGWWLGLKGNKVGWFPGSFVEMIGHASPKDFNKTSTASVSPNPSLSSESPVTVEDNKSEQGSKEALDSEPGVKTQPPKPSKLRPVRKAPPPPPKQADTNSDESKTPVSSGSKKPKLPRPTKAPPPTPPMRGGTKEAIPSQNAERDRDNTITEIKTPKPVDKGLYDLIKHPNDEDPSTMIVRDKDKPEIPKRYIKPKLVTVPRHQVQIPHVGGRNGGTGVSERVRPPPPPRADHPRLGPVRTKLSSPKPFGDQSQSEDEECMFGVFPQRKFDGVLRQESSDQDTVPYNNTMSSFGSTFGKRENVKQLPKDDKVETNVNSAIDITKSSKTVSPISISGTDTASVEIPQADGLRKLMEHKTDDEIDSYHADISKETLDHNGKTTEAEAEINNTTVDVKVPSPSQKNSFTSENIDDKNGASDTQCEIENIQNADKSKPSKLPRTQKLEAASKIPSSVKVAGLKKDGHHDVSDECDKLENQVECVPDPKSEQNQAQLSDRIGTDLGEVNSQQSVVKIENARPDDDIRQRTDSFDRPPIAPKPKSKGLPKLLPKPKPSHQQFEDAAVESHENGDNSVNGNERQSSIPPPEESAKKEPESTVDSSTKNDSKVVSKIPLGSKIAKKSPQIKSKKSHLPTSPKTKSPGRVDQSLKLGRTSESDSEPPLSPGLSPKKSSEVSETTGREGQRKQSTSSEKSLRNRSQSPHSRKGIPTSIRQRSNSPVSKLPAKSSGIPSPTGNQPNKPSGLVAPKKINKPKENTPVVTNSVETPVHILASEDGQNDNEVECNSPKLDHQAKPPKPQIQKSVETKPAKQGKSLLPLIHKSMGDGGTKTAGPKGKTGIPRSKPPRPPAPKTSVDEVDKRSAVKGGTLFQAVRGYTATSEEELSFVEGTFIKELSDCDRVGWFVGMLADGTTGLYPADHFKPSPVQALSEA